MYTAATEIISQICFSFQKLCYQYFGANSSVAKKNITPKITGEKKKTYRNIKMPLKMKQTIWFGYKIKKQRKKKKQ